MKSNIIKAWSEVKEIIINDIGDNLIYGYFYDEDTKENTKEMGIYFRNGDKRYYPYSRSREPSAAPFVIHNELRIQFLEGMLFNAIKNNDIPKIEKIREAISFFNN